MGISNSGTIIYTGFFGAFSNLRMDLAGKRAWTRNLLLFDPFLSCPMANQENGRKAVWSPHFLLKRQNKAPNRGIFMIAWRIGWAWGFAAGPVAGPPQADHTEQTQHSRPAANAALHLGPFRIFNDLCGALHFEMRSISQRVRSTTLTP